MEADPEVVFTTCFQRVPKGWSIWKVDKCLHELATLRAKDQDPLITIYRAGSKSYLQITSADAHIYRRAKDSKYPSPEAGTPHLLTAREIKDEGGCTQVCADSLDSRTPNPDPRTPIPELRIPILESRIKKIPRTSEDEPTQAQARGGVDSFVLTPELEAWSAKEGIPNPGQYVDEFKDYWRSCDGKRKNGQAVKDWAAAFRNRLRTLKEQGKLKMSADWKSEFLAREA